MIFAHQLRILCAIAFVVLTGTALAISCSTSPAEPAPIVSPGPTPVYTCEIIRTYPHDRNAFTQGLVFKDNILFEGTGLRGHSSLRRVELETGDILQISQLPERFFGEGITIYEGNIIQLTWQSGAGFVYAKNSFELLDEFTYPTEGWGITHDGNRLIMSDGTATLRFMNPETFEEIDRIDVFDSTGPVVRLNELEYIQGEIYANIWQTDRIARIDPETGRVIGWIDLTGILGQEDRIEPVDVLNGIAYDAENDRLFVTGKLWPRLFEIKLISAEQ
jgi:glutamine cyclotransferase